MSQRWLDLTFLHWAVDPARVAGRMPPGVRVDTRDGQTYVGLVLFDMVGAGFGTGPAVPYAGTFLETNVRLYSVDRQGRHGVVFLSLDADRLPVVLGARAALRLPYRWARMRHDVTPADARRAEDPRGAEHRYTATLRRPPGRPSPSSRVRVRVGERRPADERDRFLTDRFGLHTALAGRTLWVPNAHADWTLWSAEVLELDDELVASVGLPGVVDAPPDQVAFSRGVRTTFGFPRR